MPKIAVIGSRTYSDRNRIFKYLDQVNSKTPDLWIVSGACPTGADAIAEAWAKARGVPLILFPADWSQGRGAGFARNARIVNEADTLVCFWDGGSKGTVNSIEQAWRLNKRVLVSTPTNPQMVSVSTWSELAKRGSRN